MEMEDTNYDYEAVKKFWEDLRGRIGDFEGELEKSHRVWKAADEVCVNFKPTQDAVKYLSDALSLLKMVYDAIDSGRIANEKYHEDIDEQAEQSIPMN